ncbi:MAG: outer membrane protein assembly factor BamD [Desulfobulbus sp.]|jgi:outer membrane protein assembly factor BamD|uniref:outer membrane protein assembly factor BamD n=1 Tax=Desulfobulbus sp. TaxID=895 RepID=UPI0028424819|nr:outer membrane protein assembly factor BamD [Desulfobulbus sp.]MDR2551492.1 outer membrane protein assembly factor BamD [Desulfobulbus sp.]
MLSRNASPCSGLKRLLLILLVATALAQYGCSMFNKVTFGEEEEAPKSKPPEELIVQGMDAYNTGDYGEAIKLFKIILDEHPFSPQAMLAELKSADAHYYNKQYAEAKVLYKSFEERHPTNEAIPYVLFQIGMCDYSRSDRIDRDIAGPQEAIKSFTRLINAYPQSPYAKEAKTRIKDAKEFLVNHEYMVAVFYVRTARYDEAKHRLKYLLARYPDSDLAPKAKELLASLEAGNRPTWGMNRWLPEFMTQAPSDRQEAKDAKKAAIEAGEAEAKAPEEYTP